MAACRRCDRCDAIFDVNKRISKINEVTLFPFLELRVFGLTENCTSHELRVDLCDDCVKDFEVFIKNRKCVSPNNITMKKGE